MKPETDVYIKTIHALKKLRCECLFNLGHEILEIRLRALRHLREKFKRSQELNEDLIFSPGNLIKHLIRWFGQHPLNEEDTVLKLIINILKSKYGPEAVHYLTKERLMKEFRKVEKILTDSEHQTFITEIFKILNEYPSTEDTYALNSLGCNDSLASNVSSNAGSISDILLDDTSDYEPPWSIPSLPDYNSLKLLSESLVADNEDDLRHAFSYLEAAIDDYPAEYFLQPPYIFNSLLLLTKKETIKTEALLHVLTKLTKSLSGRIKERQLSKVHVAQDEKNKGSSSGKQITTQRYSIVLFNLCIEFYKQSSEDLKQAPPALIYWLQREILDVITNDFHEYDFRNLFLIDLGNLAKYFRHAYSNGETESNLSRMLYIHMLKIIIELLDIESKKHIQLVPCDGTRNLKYCPQNYMSASATNNLSIDHPETWMTELECALFDLPLKEMQPELYEQIQVYSNLHEKNKLLTLLECESSLQPTLDIMKNLENFSSEQLIIEGSTALNTLLITKNIEFTMKLIGAIIDCLPRYEGNCKLRKAAEESLLKLLSHEDVPIRRSVYRECCSKVKQFFADAMNGEVQFNTHSSSSSESLVIFGMPLTNQILNNIINYGYFDDDTMVRANAEMILILILKAKPILCDRWQGFLGLLFPNLPLLQCTTSVQKSGLTALLLKLYDPDDKESGLSKLENLRGNLRFLFSKDESIRVEGLSRIIYLVSTQENAELWIPNVPQICDVILNDVCILKSPRSSERMFTRGLYDKGTVVALLELLRSPDVEPAIRKTALLQLNVMCQDAELVDFVHDQSGWTLALQALENSLKKDGAIDYPDAAIPAVGILCKIILCQSELRRALAEEIEVYYLLIRALFAFPCEEAFKHDCISTIFLLVFSSLIVGSKRISIPVPCSELQTPIVCSYYSQNVKNVERSPLEQAYANVFANKANCSPSARLSNLDLQSSGTSVMDCVLMYFRLQFATMWCDGFENILNEYNGHQSFATVPTKECKDKRNNCLASLRDFLKYNPDLIIKHSDIEAIRICSQNENLKLFLYDVSNAVTHENVLDSIAKIQLCLSISRKITSHQQKNILNSFKRFLMAAPKCNRDVILFKNIITLLTYLILADNQDTLFLTLTELRSKHCVFLNILNKDTFSTCLYRANCKFLRSVVKQCMYHSDQNEINSYLIGNKNGEKFNVYNNIFENGLKVLEEHFRNREIDRFRVVLNLMQFVSASNSTDLDISYTISVAKKMIDFIIKLKSFSQTGSHINKNALLIVRNIFQDVDEIVLEEVYLKYLSGLCAHQDYKIRALSWCILIKISCSLKGAHSLVKVLSYLPGGCHACCLSTLLDTQEAPVVRAAAGGLFANLLKYTKETAGRKTINISVAPLCSNMKALESEDGLKLLLRLFNTHRFYDRMDETLVNFYVSDVIVYNEKECITTCDIVKSYCSILINLVDLYPELLLQYYELPCFQKLFDVVKSVPMCTSESSLSMLAEICHLLTKFIQTDECLTTNFLARSENFIYILLDLLNWDLYETTSKAVAIHILQVLNTMLKESEVYLVILENILNSDCEKILAFICQSLTCNNSLLQRSCLDWVYILLTKGQTYSQNFARFIDTTKMQNVTSVSIHNKTTKQILEMPNAKTASEVLFLVVYELFVSFEWNAYTKHSCEKQKLLSSCSEALCALLKTCRLARATASRLNFLQYIIDNLQNIFNEMGMSCAEFIRKNGDAKKQPVIDELIFMFEIILNWYYEEMLTDEKQIMDLTKILLNAWPWINHSGELRISFVTLLAFLSENSLAVCKQFSTTVAGHSTPVLQQLISLLIQETGKGKTSQMSLSLLEIGLRAMSNCCSCIEGRLQSLKFNVLDIFDKFHPSVTKSQKCWNPIIILWLKYWEVFSRYPEGATIRHTHLLCILIAKSTRDIRYQCLTILRNMAFLNSNRAALCSSEDFLYTSKSILSDGTRTEQTLILVAVWRLIAGSCKAKHAIKSTSLPKLIKIIYNDVQKSGDEADNDNFLSILEILVKILDQ